MDHWGLPRVIDEKYALLEPLGEGGHATVFRASAQLAIKVLKVAPDDHGSADLKERFRREGSLSLRHPNIVKYFDVGTTSDGSPYLLMELLDGESLDRRLDADRGPMSPRELTPIVLQVLDALTALHHNGIVHRDLKPGNIFLTGTPSRRGVDEGDPTVELSEQFDKRTVKVIDFGIAKFQGSTLTSKLHGTPAYMAPEQSAGGPVDGRADIYSLGAVCRRCLLGRRAALELSNEPGTPLELTETMDPRWRALITQAMQRDPAQRFQSAQAFAHAIRHPELPLDELSDSGPHSLAPAALATPLPAQLPLKRGRQRWELSAALALLAAALGYSAANWQQQRPSGEASAALAPAPGAQGPWLDSGAHPVAPLADATASDPSAAAASPLPEPIDLDALPELKAAPAVRAPARARTAQLAEHLDPEFGGRK